MTMYGVIVLFVLGLVCVTGNVINGDSKIQNPLSDPQPSRIDMTCNPRDKYGDCPPGYCCVRDEFLPSEVYCKRIGGNGDHCATKDSNSDCPCEPGYGCKPNIISSNFASLYGVCTKDYMKSADIFG